MVKKVRIEKKNVTVIIPVYNMEKYITCCLNSVLSQTLDNIEVICVDDGSTDASLNILRGYEEKFDNIIVYEQKRTGPAVARNYALEKARGEYVFFLDSDDYLYDNESLKILYEGAKKNNVYVAGGGRIKDEGGILSITKFHFRNEGIIKVNDIDEYGGFMRYIYNLNFLKKHKIAFPNYIRFQDEVFLALVFSFVDKVWGTNKNVYVSRSFDKIVNYYSKRVIHDLVNGYRDIALVAMKCGYQKMLEYIVSISIKMTGILCAHIIAGNDGVKEAVDEVKNIMAIENLKVDVTGSIFGMSNKDIDNYFICKRELCTNIKKQIAGKNVIIMGAGVVGKHAYDLVDEKAIFLGFAVTRKNELGAVTARGHVVKSLIEFNDYKNAVIIIAVENSIMATEMQEYAYSLGFKSTIIVNDILVDYEEFSVEDSVYAY